MLAVAQHRPWAVKMETQRAGERERDAKTTLAGRRSRCPFDLVAACLGPNLTFSREIKARSRGVTRCCLARRNTNRVSKAPQGKEE